MVGGKFSTPNKDWEDFNRRARQKDKEFDKRASELRKNTKKISMLQKLATNVRNRGFSNAVANGKTAEQSKSIIKPYDKMANRISNRADKLNKQNSNEASKLSKEYDKERENRNKEISKLSRKNFAAQIALNNYHSKRK